MTRVEQNALGRKKKLENRRDVTAENQGLTPAYSPFDLCVMSSTESSLATKRWTRRGENIEVKSYGHGKWFRARLVPVRDVHELFGVLKVQSQLQNNFIIRGQPRDADAMRHGMRKTLHEQEGGEAPYLRSVARQWVMLDPDKVRLPPGYDVRINPRACVRVLMERLAAYEPGIARTSCVVQLSASAGVPETQADLLGKGLPRNAISAHLWFMLDRPYGTDELKRWASLVNAQDGSKIIDPAPFGCAQPNYIADPEFIGMDGPIRERLWLKEGEHDALTLNIPTETVSASLPDPEGAGGLPGGLEYRQYLDMIGDYNLGKAGFQEPILKACGAAVAEQGQAVDVESVVAEITAAVRGNGGTRPQSELRRYSSMGFIRDKLQWFIRQDSVKEHQRAARQAKQDARHDQRGPEADAQTTISEAEEELACELKEADLKARDYRRMRTEFAEVKASAYARIDQDVFVRGGGRRERNRLRRIERNRLKDELAKRYGFERFVEHAPVDLFRVTCGLGKTRRMLERLATRKSGRVEFFSPNHDQLDEAFTRYMAANPRMPGHPIKGRGQEDPAGRAVGRAGKWHRSEHLMCPRAATAAVVGRTEKSVQEKLCADCPLKEICGYQAQFKGIVEGCGVVFLPQAYLKIGRPQQLGGAVELCVIDENPTKEFSVDHSFENSMLFRPDRVAEMLIDPTEEGALMTATRLLGNALRKRQGLAPMADEREECLRAVIRALDGVIRKSRPMKSLDKSELRRALQYVEKANDGVAFEPDSSHDEIARVVEAGEDRRMLEKLLAWTLACMKRGVDIRDTMQIGRDEVTMTVFVEPVIARDTPVIVLDATASERHLREVIGREIDAHVIQVAENIRLTQVDDFSGSKSALIGRSSLQRRESAPEAKLAEQQRRAKALLELAERFSGGAPTLIVHHREFLADFTELGMPTSCEIIHFGALRGLNRFEHMAKLVVIGRQSVNCAALERHRMALYVARGNVYGGGVVPWTMSEYLLDSGLDDDDLHGGYLTDDVGNPWHPDEITDDLRRDVTENEILQAVGRLRSIRPSTSRPNGEPVEALLITALHMEDLPQPERRVKWLDMIRHGRVGGAIQIYADECADRTKNDRALGIPFGMSDMVALAPKIFRTEKAAKRAREKLDVNTVAFRMPNEWTRVAGRYWKGDARRGAPLIGAVARGVNDIAGAVMAVLAPLIRDVRKVEINVQEAD